MLISSTEQSHQALLLCHHVDKDLFWKGVSSPTSCFCNLLFILEDDKDTNCAQYKIKLEFEMYACPETSKETLLLFSFFIFAIWDHHAINQHMCSVAGQNTTWLML